MKGEIKVSLYTVLKSIAEKKKNTRAQKCTGENLNQLER